MHIKRKVMRLNAIRITALALMLPAATQAPASGMPVFDGANFSQSIQNILKTMQQWKKEAVHWSKEAAHMKQQLIKLNDYLSANTLMANIKVEDLKKRDLLEGAVDACPGASGSVVKDLLAPFTLDRGADIRSQQVKLCVQIVALQNKQFNETVDILDSLNARANQWTTIDLNRVTGESEGELAGSMSEIESFAIAMEQDLSRWEAINQGYATQLGLLQQSQQQLAMMAMRGANEGWVVGAVKGAVQGAILKRALQKKLADQ